jgi:hypothetical protein
MRIFLFFQCFIPVRIRIRIDFCRAKKTHKNRKKFRNFMFCRAGCNLLRGEGSCCILDVLYGGLGIAIFHQKKKNYFSCKFFQFWTSKPWIRIRIRIDLKCRIRIETNADPKHCFIQHCFICGPSDSTVSEDAKDRAPTTWLYVIQ